MAAALTGKKLAWVESYNKDTTPKHLGIYGTILNTAFNPRGHIKTIIDQHKAHPQQLPLIHFKIPTDIAQHITTTGQQHSIHEIETTIKLINNGFFPYREIRTEINQGLTDVRVRHLQQLLDYKHGSITKVLTMTDRDIQALMRIRIDRGMRQDTNKGNSTSTLTNALTNYKAVLFFLGRKCKWALRGQVNSIKTEIIDIYNIDFFNPASQLPHGVKEYLMEKRGSNSTINKPDKNCLAAKPAIWLTFTTHVLQTALDRVSAQV